MSRSIAFAKQQEDGSWEASSDPFPNIIGKGRTDEEAFENLASCLNMKIEEIVHIKSTIS